MNVSQPVALLSGLGLLACLGFAWVSELEPARDAAPGPVQETVSTVTSVAPPPTPTPTPRASESPRIEPGQLPASERLRPAIASGLAPEQIAALLDGLPLAELGALFEAETHMGMRWMQERGIDEAGQRRLAALWLSTSASTLPPAVEGTIAFRGQETAADPVAVLTAQEHQINAAFSVPAGYRQDAVIVRWVDLENRSLVSLDRHIIAAGEKQEIWMRASQDWKPGRYRVEVFAADAGLHPLAGANLNLQNKDPQ